MAGPRARGGTGRWSATPTLLLSLAIGLGSMGSAADASPDARDAGCLYLSPVPGASHVVRGTKYVLVRFVDVSPDDVTNLSTDWISVTGDGSGVHTGTTHVASDGRTVIFTMPDLFTNGEIVTVGLDPRLASGGAGAVDAFDYQFRVEGRMPDADAPADASPSALAAASLDPDAPEPTYTSQRSVRESAPGPAGARIMPNGVAVPSGFPEAVITVDDAPSPGYLFLTNAGWDGRHYRLILDNDGLPAWYQECDDADWDFKVQDNGAISWRELSRHVAYTEDFEPLGEYWTGNSYYTDGHDFQLLETGHYLKIAARWHTVDMTEYLPGANPAAQVKGTVIQEFTPEGDLIFQWRAWDHYDVRDTELYDPMSAQFNFPHMNAVDVDADGHLLVSSRALNEVTKFDRDTGEIIWRLGGAHNQFAFVGDSLNGFSCQHDIRGLGGGRYLLFDNGNLRTPRVSRSVEYELDLNAMTATLVWQFRDTPDRYTVGKGGSQRLANGNTIVNFVQPEHPKVVEVDPSGGKLFEMFVVPGSALYRSYRFPWNGTVAVPYLIVEPSGDNVTLVFNKFGDPDVDHYRIYAGTSPEPTELLATSDSPMKRFAGLENGVEYHFRVTAVSTGGVESAYSNEESLVVRTVAPGGNLLQNGEFAAGTDWWDARTTDPAVVVFSVEKGAARIQIDVSGSYPSDIQVLQSGLAMYHGREYRLEFDAWADTPRIFDTLVGNDSTPFTDYSGLQPFTVTPARTTYSYTFTMNAPSDFDATLVFNAGGHPADVFIDAVSLVLLDYAAADIDNDGRVDLRDVDLLTDDWLRAGQGLAADIDGSGKVDAGDLAILGEEWTGPMD